MLSSNYEDRQNLINTIQRQFVMFAVNYTGLPAQVNRRVAILVMIAYNGEI